MNDMTYIQYKKYKKYKQKYKQNIGGSNPDDTEWYSKYIDRIKNMPNNKKYISIEANIGTGKSTLLETFNSYNKNLLILVEPLQLWGEWLGKLYDGYDKTIYPNKNPNITTFQFKVFKSYYDILNSPENQLSHGLITERSPLTALNIFSVNSLEQNDIDNIEFDLIKDYFNILFNSENLPDISIYLRVSNADISLKRIKKRNRDSEENIPEELIKQLHDKHETYYNNDNTSTIIEIRPNKWIKRKFKDSGKLIYVINADESKSEVVNIAKLIINNIYGTTDMNELD